MGNLIEELKQFTGSDTFYRHSLCRKYVYTEGVFYLAEKAGAHWLVDYILSNQLDKQIVKQGFQVWIIEVEDDSSAIIRIEDGNHNLVKKFQLTFTNFPLKRFTLWLIDNTLLLPSEY